MIWHGAIRLALAAQGQARWGLVRYGKLIKQAARSAAQHKPWLALILMEQTANDVKPKGIERYGPALTESALCSALLPRPWVHTPASLPVSMRVGRGILSRHTSTPPQWRASEPGPTSRYFIWGRVPLI